MKRKRFPVEQIVRMLREAEVFLSQGKSVKLLSRELEQENTRLKKAVADLTLDKLLLREALEGNY